MRINKRNMQRGVSGLLGGVVAGLLQPLGCAHRQAPLDAEAKQAVTETRGLCPTDLNQTQMLVRDDGTQIAVAFRTDDPSKIEEVSRRAAEIGEALAVVHPAVSQDGALIQHTPAPKPELRELATSAGYGVELVFHSPPERRPALLTNLTDHERMWRRGECPVMTDESVRAREINGWKRTDR
jgi:hypothetical protein